MTMMIVIIILWISFSPSWKKGEQMFWIMKEMIIIIMFMIISIIIIPILIIILILTWKTKKGSQ